MANEVYANGREVACKAAAGQTVAAFPDPCLSPPSPPAGPLPVPYPNTAYASDTTNGSTTVMISGQEIMLKDRSAFKKSTGNEAATKSLGMGVVTHTIQGEASFTSWSMDVKIEGENADRHLDMTVNNEQCYPPNAPPWLYKDKQAADNSKICEEEKQAAKEKCEGAKPHPEGGLDCSKPCAEAQACVLHPKSKDKKVCCHPNTTGHHLIEVHCFSQVGKRGTLLTGMQQPGFRKYSQSSAPCACASEARDDGTHGVMHAVQGEIEAAFNQGSLLHSWPGEGPLIRGTDVRQDAASRWTYKDARYAGLVAHHTAFPQCNSECIKRQLDEYHTNQCGIDDDTKLRSDPEAGGRSAAEITDDAMQQEIENGVAAARGVATGGIF